MVAQVMEKLNGSAVWIWRTILSVVLIGGLGWSALQHMDSQERLARLEENVQSIGGHVDEITMMMNDPTNRFFRAEGEELKRRVRNIEQAMDLIHPRINSGSRSNGG